MGVADFNRADSMRGAPDKFNILSSNYGENIKQKFESWFDCSCFL